MTKAQAPNLCADGFFPLPLEHPNSNTFQTYSCTGPQITCSPGFTPAASVHKNGKVVYECQHPITPPKIPPNG
jgi:hypothetical protein